MPHKDVEKRKEYHRRYHKEYYKRNKQYYKDKNERLRKEKIEWIRSLKTKCENCPENFFACLEFHHIDPNKKEMTITNAVNRGWGKERIRKELAKCIILCSNCHRKLHWSKC